MLIDWFTVVAQTINFLILVWLLRRFLYRPVLNAIDAREKLVAAELADADQKREVAKKEQDEFQRRNEEFNHQRAALLAKAAEDAVAEGERLLGQAREAADELAAKRSEALALDARNLNHAIRRRAQDEVFAIARRALVELAGASVEEQVVDRFVQKLRSLDSKERDDLKASLRGGGAEPVIRSALDLPVAQRTSIESAIKDVLNVSGPVHFDLEPDLVSGIELVANGQKIGWSIADYLTSLERGVDEVIGSQSRPEPTQHQRKRHEATNHHAIAHMETRVKTAKSRAKAP